MVREWRPARGPALHRLQPSRARVYQAIWIVGAVFALAWALGIWGNWTEVKRSATASPKSIYSYVDTEPGVRSGTTRYVTKYTFEVAGIRYSDAQQRSVPGDYAVPAFVCYDPNDPATNALGFPDEVGCGNQGGSGFLYDPSDPLYWITQVCILGLLLGGTALAFSKWRFWRAESDLIG